MKNKNSIYLPNMQTFGIWALLDPFWKLNSNFFHGPSLNP